MKKFSPQTRHKKYEIFSFPNFIRSGNKLPKKFRFLRFDNKFPCLNSKFLFNNVLIYPIWKINLILFDSVLICPKWKNLILFNTGLIFRLNYFKFHLKHFKLKINLSWQYLRFLNLLKLTKNFRNFQNLLKRINQNNWS